MRIATLQASGTMGDIDANLRELAATAAKCAERGVDLLITPEMFVTGYNLEDFDGLAQPADGEIAAAVTDLARRHQLSILYGYCEAAGQLRFNAAQLIDREGRSLCNYRKSHLYGDTDRRAFQPGDSAVVTELGEIRIGVLICFDVEFPEAVRDLALQGAQLVLAPTSLMRPYEFVATSVVPVRAYENQLFLAYANRVGTERELDYCGLSAVVGPDGAMITRAGPDADLLVADLDFSQIERVRAQVNYLDNRRPQSYRHLCQ